MEQGTQRRISMNRWDTLRVVVTQNQVSGLNLARVSQRSWRESPNPKTIHTKPKPLYPDRFSPQTGHFEPDRPQALGFMT